jgi:hypothetical protein
MRWAVAFLSMRPRPQVTSSELPSQYCLAGREFHLPVPSGKDSANHAYLYRRRTYWGLAAARDFLSGGATTLAALCILHTPWLRAETEDNCCSQQDRD